MRLQTLGLGKSIASTLLDGTPRDAMMASTPTMARMTAPSLPARLLQYTAAMPALRNASKGLW